MTCFCFKWEILHLAGKLKNLPLQKQWWWQGVCVCVCVHIQPENPKVFFTIKNELISFHSHPHKNVLRLFFADLKRSQAKAFWLLRVINHLNHNYKFTTTYIYKFGWNTNCLFWVNNNNKNCCVDIYADLELV